MQQNVEKILYVCKKSGIVDTMSYEYPARFSIVTKYMNLYQEERSRFKKSPLDVYALPLGDIPKKVYNGLDRKGIGIFDIKKRKLNDSQKKILKIVEMNASWSAEDIMTSEVDMQVYLSCFKNAEKCELIWSRISGSNENVPEGYHFIGYDITYPPDDDGAFSIINDCMFICRWHGCDEEGILFAEDFEKLNHNGLFDFFRDAYDYMIKYTNEDWTETGEYGIFEIYMK